MMKDKILLVDDSPLSRGILVRILKLEYDVTEAESGEEALEKLVHMEPSLILLDIVLSGMSGFECLVKIKAQKRLEKIPVICITSLSTTDDEEKGLMLGAVDYITKPFKHKIVMARIKTHITLYHYQKKIQELLMIDGLTGLKNRRGFDEYLTQQWEDAKFYKNSCSLILIDIDFFKRYNDTYGHLAGDDALKKVGMVINFVCETKNAYGARYGGEEFAVIIPHSKKEEAIAIARFIKLGVEGLNLPHKASTAKNILSISIGGATIAPTPDQPCEDLITSADEMLYKSKDNGRDCITWL